LVIDSLSAPTNITISENNLAIAVEKKELSLELEKKFYSITKGAPTSAYFNYVKNMASTNIQNANILYDFIITEQNHTNVRLSTRLSYIKVICLFNRYLSYRDFTKITKNDILDYLNSLKRSELDDPTHKWINTYNTRQAMFKIIFDFF
jgi:predicted component of type VI protein secretion system